jgi:hypothetical protein
MDFIPVQSPIPEKKPFSSNALLWTWVLRNQVNLEIATIHLQRLEDFLNGESRLSQKYETSFYIRRSKGKPPDNADWLKITTYCCHFGPQNILARLPVPPPRKGTYPEKGKDSRPPRRKGIQSTFKTRMLV